MSLHTYTPTEWKNAPDHKTTPINATNLNNIETGVENAYADIADIVDGDIGITFDNTGTDLVSENVEDAIKEVNTKANANVPKTDVATIEAGSTASRAYSVGELVYISGVLYKVISAIASGASFTVNTNVSVENISEAILQKAPYPDFSKTTLGSITTQSGSFTATKDCYCLGTITNSNGGQAIVYVNGYGVIATNNNTVSFSFPFKKGWSMTTRTTYGIYGITFFDV